MALLPMVGNKNALKTYALLLCEPAAKNLGEAFWEDLSKARQVEWAWFFLQVMFLQEMLRCPEKSFSVKAF